MNIAEIIPDTADGYARRVVVNRCIAMIRRAGLWESDDALKLLVRLLRARGLSTCEVGQHLAADGRWHNWWLAVVRAH